MSYTLHWVGSSDPIQKLFNMKKILRCSVEPKSQVLFWQTARNSLDNSGSRVQNIFFLVFLYILYRFPKRCDRLCNILIKNQVLYSYKRLISIFQRIIRFEKKHYLLSDLSKKHSDFWNKPFMKQFYTILKRSMKEKTDLLLNHLISNSKFLTQFLWFDRTLWYHNSAISTKRPEKH